MSESKMSLNPTQQLLKLIARQIAKKLINEGNQPAEKTPSQEHLPVLTKSPA